MPGIRHSRVVRNIHFVNSENDEIGGAWQNGTLTWAEMAEWMHITYQLPLSAYAPHRCLEGGNPNPMTMHGDAILSVDKLKIPIQPGWFVLLSLTGNAIDIPINPEEAMQRSVTRSLSNPDPRTSSFRARIRERDGQCVISRIKPSRPGNFTGLEAAHIFPVAQLQRWKDEHWQGHISDDKYDGETGIHSIQNGILLNAYLHAQFDNYMFAINPDNDYKAYYFGEPPAQDGAIMFRNPDVPAMYQPSRALLKAHFRMAVLYNMKGAAGYIDWDEDIPPGCDEIAEMAEAEDGKLWFETVLAGKLNSLIA